MLKDTYCYSLFLFFFGLFFVSTVFGFASLYVFIASLTRPVNFKCITRFGDLKTESGEFHPLLRKVFGKMFLSKYFHQKISTMSEVKMLYLIETLVHVQQSDLCVSAPWLQVRNVVFFKQCMGKALDNLETDDANEIDDGPFELYD